MKTDSQQARQTLRSPAVQQQYDHDRLALQQRYGNHVPCPLCDRSQPLVRHRTATMIVTDNDYPYWQFDGREVSDHVMLVPYRHVASMEDFTVDERRDYLQLIARYHSKGYSSMTRSLTDDNRTVPLHLHTHLLRYGAPLIS